MAYIRLIRPLNLFIIIYTLFAVRACCFYPVFDFRGIYPHLSGGLFLIYSLAFVLIAAGGYVINDVYDLEMDKKNKPDKVIIDKFIPEKKAIQFYWVLSIAGLILGYWTCYKASLPSLGML